ncbi:MAG: hypothetical protein P8K79_08595 [Mariniblastus sp.]|nr:hypothetical protein [Mariniblastus sp.]
MSSNGHRPQQSGRQMMEILEQRLGGFLLELAQSELDETFPF